MAGARPFQKTARTFELPDQCAPFHAGTSISLVSTAAEIEA